MKDSKKRSKHAEKAVPIDTDGDWKQSLPPITRSLVGSLAGSKLNEDDYHRHLEEKHR